MPRRGSQGAPRAVGDTVLLREGLDQMNGCDRRRHVCEKLLFAGQLATVLEINDDGVELRRQEDGEDMGSFQPEDLATPTEAYCSTEDKLTQMHAVRCCSSTEIPGYQYRPCSGIDVWTAGQQELSELWTASEVPGLEGFDECQGNRTIAEAQAICESMGARLCSRAEMEADCTTKTGCNFDRELIWTSTECGGSVEPVWATASAGEVSPPCDEDWEACQDFVENTHCETWNQCDAEAWGQHLQERICAETAAGTTAKACRHAASKKTWRMPVFSGRPWVS